MNPENHVFSAAELQLFQDLLEANPYASAQTGPAKIAGLEMSARTFWRVCFWDAPNEEVNEPLQRFLAAPLKDVWQCEPPAGRILEEVGQGGLQTFFFAHLAVTYGPEMASCLSVQDGELRINQAKQKQLHQRFVADLTLPCEQFCRLHNVDVKPNDLFTRLHQVARAILLMEDDSGGCRVLKRKEQLWRAIFGAHPRWLSMDQAERVSRAPIVFRGPDHCGQERVLHLLTQSRFRFSGEAHDAQQSGFLKSNPDTLCFDATLVPPEQFGAILFGASKPAAFGLPDNHQGLVERCGPRTVLMLKGLSALDSATAARLAELIRTGQWAKLGETHQKVCPGLMAFWEEEDMQYDEKTQNVARSITQRCAGRQIDVPPLRERLRDPAQAHYWINVFMANWFEGIELDRHHSRFQHLIETTYGADYAWPGQLEEFQRCVEHYCLNGDVPRALDAARTSALSPEDESVLRALREGNMNANQWLSQYCTRIYARTNNYEEAARILSMDRRTVKARVDTELLERLRETTPGA